MFIINLFVVDLKERFVFGYLIIVWLPLLEHEADAIKIKKWD